MTVTKPANHPPDGAGQRASVRHTDAPSGLPRVLSWLGRLSCRNTGSHLNGRHPRPVNAYAQAKGIE